MIKHIVTFKLTGTPAERKEVANKFKDALMALPLTIDVLKSIEVGINENPSESWDIVLTFQAILLNPLLRNHCFLGVFPISLTRLPIKLRDTAREKESTIKKQERKS